MNKPITLEKHGVITRLLHWTCALLVLGLFFTGWIMVDLDYYNSWYQTLPEIHILAGCSLLLLWCWVIIRLFSQPTTLADLNHKKLESFLAQWIKRMFYLFVMIILVCGYLMTTADGKSKNLFDLINLPALSHFSPTQIDTLGWIHRNLSYLLMTLVGLHILGALKHHFIDNDNTLKRML
ncbi:MAG: cytochrome b [Marinicella sp.]